MRKNKIQLTPIEFPVIDGFIHYFVEHDIERAHAFLRTKGLDKDDVPSGRGMTMKMSDGNPIVWMKSKKRNIVVHEMIHAVMALFEGIGVDEITRDNDEFFAYFVDYSVDQVIHSSSTGGRVL